MLSNLKGYNVLNIKDVQVILAVLTLWWECGWIDYDTSYSLVTQSLSEESNPNQVLSDIQGVFSDHHWDLQNYEYVRKHSMGDCP